MGAVSIATAAPVGTCQTIRPWSTIPRKSWRDERLAPDTCGPLATTRPVDRASCGALRGVMTGGAMD